MMDSRDQSSASSGLAGMSKSESVSPGLRPSYCDYSSTFGLALNFQGIRDDVVRKLDLSSLPDDSMISEDGEKLKTFLRIRPVSDPVDYTPVLEIKDENTVVASMPRRNALFYQPDGTRKQTEFKFTKVLGPGCGQSTVFEECVTPIIEKFLNHENCLIFSYGATNSGKTYTMQGHGTEYGIIPRTLDAIFSRIHDRQYKIMNIRPHLYQAFQHLNPAEIGALRDKRERIIADANIKQELMSSYHLASSRFSDRTGSTVELLGVGNFNSSSPEVFHANTNLYSVWVSFAELYNERVYDLLDLATIKPNKRRKELKLMQDRNGYVYIKDLTELPVTSDEEAYKIFLAGRKNLQFAATQMNQNSSRSHSFFTIRIVSVGIGDGIVPYPKTVHRMTFCDLAGMERASQTENKGFRLQESGNINNSLTVLLKVIRVLREKQTQNGPAMIETIPFRESKLTHIFKSYFTSATHICMLVNVNPDPAVAETTFQVLQNSAIASNVIVFRPIDVNVQAQPFEQKIDKIPTGKPPMPPKKCRKNGAECSAERKRSLTEESSDSEQDNYGIQTVIAPKTMMQRMMILEAENERLRRLVMEKDVEIAKIREEALRIVAEERSQWRNRMEQYKVTEENFNRRRLSLVRVQNQLSPASRCGQCSPPVADMEDIDETLELEEEEEDSDKEN